MHLVSHPDLLLLKTYVFLIPIVVGILCEMTKLILASVRKGSINYDAFFHAGGFPSTHSAFVTSLLMVVWRKMGVESVEFAIVLVFAVLTWYDAMGSRREIGEQAKMLNLLQHVRHFQTQIGHSAFEVFGGILFGALITWLGIWLSV